MEQMFKPLGNMWQNSNEEKWLYGNQLSTQNIHMSPSFVLHGQVHKI